MKHYNIERVASFARIAGTGLFPEVRIRIKEKCGSLAP
jgi:hypothetical protein